MRSQIIITILGAALTVLAGVLVYQLTTREPTLVLVVADPDVALGQNKVRQIVAIRNKGDNLAKGVQIVFNDMKWRIEKHIVSGQPPVECTLNYDKIGFMVLNCGHLKPNAVIMIQILHKRPALRNKEINVYSDNVTATKITKSFMLVIQEFREGM